MTYAENIVRNLRQLREHRGMTYTALAAAVQLPILAVRRMERGERRVDVDELHALAGALGVSVQRLWGGPPSCLTCLDAPPSGFLCGSCGQPGAAPVVA